MTTHLVRDDGAKWSLHSCPSSVASDGTDLEMSGVTSSCLGYRWRFAHRPAPDEIEAPVGGTGTLTWRGHWRSGIDAADPFVEAAFVHVARPENVAGDATYLTHPRLDGNGGKVFVVSKNWNPAGTGGTYDTGEIYLSFDVDRDQWRIRRADGRAFSIGSAFNVLIPSWLAIAGRHRTDRENTAGNQTYLHWTSIAAEPDARLIVTPVRSRYEYAGGYVDEDVVNDHPVGVWYDRSRSGWVIFNQDRSAMPTETSFNVFVAPRTARSVTHRSDSDNTSGHVSSVENPLLNGHPEALIQHTQIFNPGGSFTGVYNPAPTGIYRTGSVWAVFNQDHTPLPLGAGFNLFEPSPLSAFSIERMRGSGSWFPIESPFVERYPAPVQLTQNRTASGSALNTREAGVLVSAGVAFLSPNGIQVGIANLDLTTSMPSGAAANVWAPPMDLASFVHVAGSANTFGHYTELRHPMLDDRRAARVFITARVRSSGADRIAGALGVWWSTADRWNVFHQDGTPIPAGMSFNVHVAKPGEASFVHTVSADNADGSRTRLTHPALDGNPAARLIVTQNWNPPGSAGVYNRSAVGVRWAPLSQRWQITNLDGTDLPLGASFNVLIPQPVCADADFDAICDGEDRCPSFAARHNLADVDDDGRGDECECGDADGDGRVGVRDLVAINEITFGRREPSPLCDANGDDRCDVGDIVSANAGIFGRELHCSRHPAR